MPRRPAPLGIVNRKTQTALGLSEDEQNKLIIMEKLKTEINVRERELMENQLFIKQVEGSCWKCGEAYEVAGKYQTLIDRRKELLTATKERLAAMREEGDELL